MGVRKKHHYIPRFYLKRFSINYEGKLIALYNLKNKLFIQNAPIKHQACNEYLYGEDDFVENELAKLENAISKMFYHWTEEKILIPPPQDSNAFILLKRYILYQIFRTIKEGNNVIELLDQAFKAFIKVYHPEHEKELEGGKLVTKDPVLLSLLSAVDKEYLLNFLDCRFIVNLSDLPFITSDSPAIRYNQLMESVGLYTGSTGLPTKGLQIFLPIHTRLMICLYDPICYCCGTNSINCVSTESIDDIHQLNILQYLNCDRQLFFDDLISQEYIEDIVEQYEPIKHNFGPVSSLTKTKTKSHLYFSSYEDARINLDLTFFKILEKVKNIKYELAPLRHPSLERREQE